MFKKFWASPRKKNYSGTFLLWQHTAISYKLRKTNSNFCLNFRTGEGHTKVRGVRATNLKMDKAEVRAVIKYLQKKSMTPKEIHEDRMQIFADNSLSNATVKKWAVKFKWLKDCTEGDSCSGHLKTSITDDQVDAIHQMVLDDRHLTVQPITNPIVLVQTTLF